MSVSTLLVGRLGRVDRVHLRKAMTNHRVALGCVLVVAAGTRAIWAFVAAPTPESDFLTFFQTAQAIAHGQWMSGAYGWAWQGPAYPLLIAPLTLLGPMTMPAIHAANVTLGVLSVWLIHRLAVALFGSKVGLIAGAVAAVYPGLWLWAPILSAENLSIPIFTAIALLVVEKRSPARLIGLGILTGCLVFVRPSALFFIVVVLASVVWFAPGGMRARQTLMVVGGLVLAMGAVMALNVRAGGPALPVGASGWQPWLVYNEHATGAWFPAQDGSDYPFRGLENDPRLADVVRGAQAKLALEFAVLNPTQIVPGVIQRHTFNWERDDAALDWTGRRPSSRPVAQTLSPILDSVVSRSYALVLVLAFLALWTLGSRLEVVIVFILPVAYLAAPAVIAEGNARYHVNALGFLIPLAAAAIATHSRRHRWIVGFLALAILVFGSQAYGLNSVVVFGILAVGAARILLEGVRIVRAAVSTGEGRRRLLWTAAGAVLASELLLIVALATVRQAVADWSVARPVNWTTYRSGSEAAAPAVLRPSSASHGMRTVSFSEAALLPVADASVEKHAGLARLFPALEPGGRYVIYLQISDPVGIPEGRIRVLANGRSVWDSGEAGQSVNGWHYVGVPWYADSPFLFLQVDRTSTSPRAPDVLVRSVHLYPKY
jgi:hypothetical protein